MKKLISAIMMLSAAGAVRAEAGPETSPYATGGEVSVTDLGNFRKRYVHVFTNTDEVATFKGSSCMTVGIRSRHNLI